MGMSDDTWDDDTWDDLLGHIRHQVLVPVVGPDSTVVNVDNAQQTFTTLIGQRLAEKYRLTLSPGKMTMGDAVGAFLRERGRDEVERLYRVINDIIVKLDPAGATGVHAHQLAALDGDSLCGTATLAAMADSHVAAAVPSRRSCPGAALVSCGPRGICSAYLRGKDRLSQLSSSSDVFNRR